MASMGLKPHPFPPRTTPNRRAPPPYYAQIDVSIESVDDIAAAIVRAPGIPPGADLYLQTARPDGSLRWQPLTAVTTLPKGDTFVVKVRRPRGSVTALDARLQPAARGAGGTPAAHNQ
jgi:hypothetical protein